MTQLDFADENAFANKDYHNFVSTSYLPRHRWYYFKEGFSASLVHEAISSHSQDKRTKLQILDPFSGSGTTALVAALNEHYCISFEVNPFLAFVAQVKTSDFAWDRKEFNWVLDQVVERSGNGIYSPLEDFSTFCEKPGLDKWLFNRSVLRRYAALIQQNGQVGGLYKDAIKLAAIVAAFECSNTKRDGKGLRYKKGWQQRKYASKDFLREFYRQASMMIDDAEAYPINPEYEPSILLGDSREALQSIEDNKFDVVVTSPPYLNSFDYSDVYRPELFLGGFVNDNAELTNIRMETVRSHVQVNWSAHLSYESALLTPIIEELCNSENLWNKKIPLMVKAYFDDMWRILTQVHRTLRNQGSAWIVVSTSAYGGVEIPVDTILANIGVSIGFVLKDIHILRQLRSSGQQWKQLKATTAPLRESLIIFKKE